MGTQCGWSWYTWPRVPSTLWMGQAPGTAPWIIPAWQRPGTARSMMRHPSLACTLRSCLGAPPTIPRTDKAHPLLFIACIQPSGGCGPQGSGHQWWVEPVAVHPSSPRSLSLSTHLQDLFQVLQLGSGWRFSLEASCTLRSPRRACVLATHAPPHLRRKEGYCMVNSVPS